MESIKEELNKLKKRVPIFSPAPLLRLATAVIRESHLLTYTLEETTQLVRGLRNVDAKLDSEERQRLWTHWCNQHLVFRHVALLTGYTGKKKKRGGAQHGTRHFRDSLSGFHRKLGCARNLVERQNPLDFLQALLGDLQTLLVWHAALAGEAGAQQ